MLKEKAKTALILHHGIYRFIPVPCRLRNASGTFQCKTSTTLLSVKWQFALVYMEVIFIFSTSPEQHKDHVHKVLTLLKSPGETLKLMCQFFTDNIDYLGHVIRPRRLEIALHTHTPLADCKRPAISQNSGPS